MPPKPLSWLFSYLNLGMPWTFYCSMITNASWPFGHLDLAQPLHVAYLNKIMHVRWPHCLLCTLTLSLSLFAPELCAQTNALLRSLNAVPFEFIGIKVVKVLEHTHSALTIASSLCDTNLDLPVYTWGVIGECGWGSVHKQVIKKNVFKRDISKLIDLELLGPSPTAYIHMCKDPRHWQNLWYLHSVICHVILPCMSQLVMCPPDWTSPL